jgi:hypothetical protein
MMGALRASLVTLLVASTVLFAAGVIIERSQSEGRAEPAAAHAGESGESSAESEGAEADEDSVPSGEAHANAERETVLSLDIESTPLIVLAVLAGLALAVLAATAPGRRPVVLLTIAAIAIVWAALDVREVAHQIDESRTGLAILAIAVAILHLAAGGVAVRLAARERSLGRPGTIPA